MSMFSESLRAFLKPVVPFLDDPAVSEILINGPEEVWVEKKGKLSLTEARFSEEGLLAAARNMAQYVGRPLTDERPRLDARLPDGSRIHVVLPPVARRGTTVSIRKFFPDRLGLDALIGFGSLSPDLARLLRALVALRLNVVVAGGTGSGKTSLLNMLSGCIDPGERILTIEDSAELQLQQPHLVSFETRPADRQGKGEVTIGDLLQSALRLRPDRIIVGEVRGGECFYLLQAMNTGHGGSLTTAHANTPVDTLRRLESLCLLSGVDLPLRAVRAQVASAVHVVVCCERLSDGSRKVTAVSEVLPLDEKGDYRVQDLFVYAQTGRAADGTVEGHHAPCGVLPTFQGKLAAHGYGELDAAFFDPATRGLAAPLGFSAGLGEKTAWARDAARAVAAASAAAGAAASAAAPASAAAAAAAGASGAASAAEPAPATDALTASPSPSPAPAPSPSPAPPPSPSPSPSPSPPPALSPALSPTPTPTPAPPPSPSPAPATPPPTARPAAAPRPPAARPAPAPPVPAAASASKVRAPGAVRSTPLPPAPPAPKTPPPAPRVLADEPSIQLDPELAAEVEAALPYESTLITRNPLLEQQRAADEDATNPGVRNPTRR